MGDHDSPISIHGGGTLAQAIVSQENDHWSVPDGSILASWARRMVAFVIDVTIVYSVLNLSTGGMIANALNVGLWASSDFHYSVAFATILLASHWLYWRVTGLAFSRSLGQRIMGLAIVQENGDPMNSNNWDVRSFRKLLYLIPILNLWFISRDLFRIHKRHTHQSEIDLSAGSIVAIANSLPVAHRGPIK